MKSIYPESRESGIVSILSVIFFIILMSIISVSFLRIVTDEQDQVIQDDLSKGALAASRSGVEDAKRALLYCRTNPSGAGCSGILNQTCPGMFAGGLGATLGLNMQPDGVRVGDPTSDNNERYTCVTLNQDTPDVTGKMSEGLGDFIPLRGTGTFDRIRISWHQTAVDGLAPIPTAIASNNNTRYDEWRNGTGQRYIAMPRIQLMQFNATQPLGSQTDSTAGAFLVPNNSGSNTVSITSLNRTGIADKRPKINCNSPESGYMCSAVVTFPSPPAGTEYFLFIKAFYGTPNYKIELLQGNTVVYFSDVQPQVDSTGAAANVFKRILSRVSYQYDASTFYTSNSIESGMSVCKNFSVSIDSFNNECSASGLPNSESGTTGTNVIP